MDLGKNGGVAIIIYEVKRVSDEDTKDVIEVVGKVLKYKE